MKEILQCALCGERLVQCNEMVRYRRPCGLWESFVYACGYHKINDLLPFPPETLGLEMVQLRARGKE